MINNPRAELSRYTEIIESGYEFMLAYAAQGHESDKNASPDQNVREYLRDMENALEEIGAVATATAEKRDAQSVGNYRAFLAALDTDAKKAQGVVRFVLAQTAISSQLIDNLNASIHLRALLTDLFLIDEAFKSERSD